MTTTDPGAPQTTMEAPQTATQAQTETERERLRAMDAQVEQFGWRICAGGVVCQKEDTRDWYFPNKYGELRRVSRYTTSRQESMLVLERLVRMGVSCVAFPAGMEAGEAICRAYIEAARAAKGEAA